MVLARLQKILLQYSPKFGAQERPCKPKRGDKSDESIEEEDELDAELSRLVVNKLNICKLFDCRYRKESVTFGRGTGSFGLMEAKEATISKTVEAGR